MIQECSREISYTNTCIAALPMKSDVPSDGCSISQGAKAAVQTRAHMAEPASKQKGHKESNCCARVSLLALFSLADHVSWAPGKLWQERSSWSLGHRETALLRGWRGRAALFSHSLLLEICSSLS